MGKGSIFVKIYSKKIRDTAGFNAFPGTLNVLISDREREMVRKLKGRKIEGFTLNGREYGYVGILKCMINEIDCAIVIPEKSTHPQNTIEVIAPVDLRKELGLKENSLVDVYFPENKIFS